MTTHAVLATVISRTAGSTAFSRATATLAAAAFIAFSATAAHAAEPTESQAVAIHYGDLNLTTDQGTRALYGRIVAAAHQVCDTNIGPNARLAAKAQRCVNDAVARAVANVPSTKLAELQAARARVDRG